MSSSDPVDTSAGDSHPTMEQPEPEKKFNNHGICKCSLYNKTKARVLQLTEATATDGVLRTNPDALIDPGDFTIWITHPEDDNGMFCKILKSGL